MKLAGGKIKKLRAKLHETPFVFAARLGVSERTIRRWESGETICQGIYAREITRLIEQVPAPEQDGWTDDYIAQGKL